MSRELFVAQVGKMADDGKLWARVSVALNAEERIAAMSVGYQAPRITGFLEGVALATVKVGDRLFASECTVSVSKGKPYQNDAGETITGFAATIDVPETATIARRRRALVEITEA